MSFGPSPEDLHRLIGRPVGGGPMPLLVLVEGWIEAGDALSMLSRTVLEQGDVELVAEFDIDSLVDQRMRRPSLTLNDGITERLVWPTIELSIGSDAKDQPFLALHGAEPDLHWRNFAKAVALAADSVGVSRTVLLGAYPAAAPHTRPIRVSVTSNNADLVAGWPSTPGPATVFAGVHFAIAEEMQSLGVDAIGIWAQVPYYTSTSQFPHATSGILSTLQGIIGLTFDRTDLDNAAIKARKDIAATVEENPSMASVVAGLEERFDALHKLDEEDLPSGDEIEAQVQSYLRDIDPKEQ